MKNNLAASGGLRRALALPATLYMLLGFVVPLVAVLGYSLLARDFPLGVLPEFSSAAWETATDSISLRIIARSLVVALAVTLSVLAICYPAAMAIMNLPRHWRQMLLLATSFPLITSVLLRTYGWMNLIPLEWQGTYTAVVIVVAANYLPLMLLPLTRAFERLDPNILSAARDLGATPWQAFWRVTWPLTRGGRWAGAILVFVPSLGEYVVPHFIGQGKVTLLGIAVKQAFDERNWPLAAAYSAILTGMVLLPTIITMVLTALKSRSPVAPIAAARRTTTETSPQPGAAA